MMNNRKNKSHLLLGSALLILVLGFAPNSHGQLPSTLDSINAGSYFGNRGDTIDVTIMMVNSINVGGFSLRFLYDDFTLRPISASLTPRDSALFDPPMIDTIQSGLMHIVCISRNPVADFIPIGRGNVLTVKFYIDSNAAYGQTPIHFEDRGSQTYDNAMSDSSGMILIVPVLVDGIIQILPLSIADNTNMGNVPYTLTNIPNPFNNYTSIQFNLTEAANTKLDIFDMLGRNIKAINFGLIEEGKYCVRWDGRDNTGEEVSSGVYCYSLSIDNKRIINNRMVLLK
jgi:hypothetical protein